MAPPRRDPARVHNFMVEIDGIQRASFRECSGLDTTTTPIDYREGTGPPTVQKIPGLTTYSPITLRWGTTGDAEFWDWRQHVLDGAVERRNASIVQLDERGDEVVRWNLIEAWPSKWTGPAFNATGNEISIESVEITHEGLARA
jgi:phage tail-like protein